MSMKEFDTGNILLLFLHGEYLIHGHISNFTTWVCFF